MNYLFLCIAVCLAGNYILRRKTYYRSDSKSRQLWKCLCDRVGYKHSNNWLIKYNQCLFARILILFQFSFRIRFCKETQIYHIYGVDKRFVHLLNVIYNYIILVQLFYVFILDNEVQSEQGNAGVWPWGWHRPEGASDVVQQNGVPDVMHPDLRRVRQYLEVSVYCIWKRRWCIHHSVCDCIVDHWKAHVLFGNVHGPIHQPKFCEDLGN